MSMRTTSCSTCTLPVVVIVAQCLAVMSACPWSDSEEWEDVFEMLYSSEIYRKRNGLSRVCECISFVLRWIFSSLISDYFTLGGGLESSW